MLLLLVLSVFSTSIQLVLGGGCVPRSFGHSSHVCVCNSTYCDTYEHPVASQEMVKQYVSDRPDGRRLEMTELSWSNESSTVGLTVNINRTKTFQTILGFGGAFTDAAGLNINKLSAEAQSNLIASYFSPEGAEYNIGRINMGGCDFSDRPYTYCDTVNDTELVTFNLTHDDNVYKIPYVHMAAEMSQKEIRMFASPWSAPAWMKTNNALNGQGGLIHEYYQIWAEYFVKFLDAYKANGIEFWGLTAQNEPFDGFIPDFTFNAMGWNVSMQREWVVNNLGPTLDNKGYGDVKLMVHDDQRPTLPAWADGIFEDPLSDQYVDGFAVHWYVDFLGMANSLDKVHEKYPDKFILYTEACTGSYPWDLEKVLLGSWERGQDYIFNIIEDLNHWSVGWTDWNIALDMNGGPNWAGNFVDAPIIVNGEADEFYKNPMYYGLAHFSKFIPEGSVRIGLDAAGYDEGEVQMVGVELPTGEIVVVVSNKHLDRTKTIRIVDPAREGGNEITVEIGPESVHTFMWK